MVALGLGVLLPSALGAGRPLTHRSIYAIKAVLKLGILLSSAPGAECLFAYPSFHA